MNALWLAHSDDQTRDRQFKAAAAAMMSLKPTDELEGMLAAQMVATHSAAMECYRRAMLKDQSFEAWREQIGHANKLARTYAMLMEALDRHRGKGQQKVTVEHVHVHQGGQAIVGTVSPGGRIPAKTEGQPHAKQLTHAPGQTLPGEIQAQRETVPVAGGKKL